MKPISNSDISFSAFLWCTWNLILLYIPLPHKYRRTTDLSTRSRWRVRCDEEGEEEKRRWFWSSDSKSCSDTLWEPLLTAQTVPEMLWALMACFSMFKISSTVFWFGKLLLLGQCGLWYSYLEPQDSAHWSSYTCACHPWICTNAKIMPLHLSLPISPKRPSFKNRGK